MLGSVWRDRTREGVGVGVEGPVDSRRGVDEDGRVGGPEGFL